MSKTETETTREARDDEPQVTHYVVTRCGSYGVGSKRLHIPKEGTDEPVPVCYHATQSSHPDDDGARWHRKSIKVRPYSWREGRWCEDCLREYEGEND